MNTSTPNITVSRGNESKRMLIKRADFMKKDIQYIIDKLKSSSLEDNERVELEGQKVCKMNDLENLTQKISRMHAEELEAKRLKEIQMVGKKIDSMEFAAAKRSKSDVALVKAKDAKEARIKAQSNYDSYLKYEEGYRLYDSERYPGFLFLHESILEKYGLCPWVKIEELEKNMYLVENFDKELKANVEEHRSKWLLNTEDSGEIFKNLHNKFVEKGQLCSLQKEIDKLDNQIVDFITSAFKPVQFTLWQQSLELINEYLVNPVKTKRIKERYKVLIHNISTLVSETGLGLHEFLNLKYNLSITINKIETSVSAENLLLGETLNRFNSNYASLKESYEQSNKFIYNNIRNLQNELYLFLTNQKNFNIWRKDINSCFQNGKYFKKWVSLNNEEKLERFKSFSEFYITRYMVLENILHPNEKDAKVDELYNLLVENYKNKNLQYKNLKWSIKDGIISSIKNLKFNKEQNAFYLLGTGASNKPGVQGTSTAGTSTASPSKRKISNKSIITKTNEMTINETILSYIITCQKTNVEYTKEECLEQIKEKLKMKKISISDKTSIYNKYDEILKIIEQNTN